MTKKSVKILALLTALLLVLSGCSLIAVDPVKDAAEPIIEVNGVTLTKGDLQTDFNNSVAYNVMLYSYYGMAITMEEAAEYTRDSFVATNVEQLVMLAKAAELGLDQFTEEEEAQFQADVEVRWAETLDSYADIAQITEDMTEEEKTAAKEAAALGYGVTRESFEQNERELTVLDRVYEYAVADVSVTDEDVQVAYEAQVAADETAYTTDTMAFEQNMAYGGTTMWYPEGYRTVLHLLLGYEQEVQDQMFALEVELDEINTRLAEAEANGGELFLEEGEEEVTVESLNARKAEIEAEMKAVQEAFLAANQATVDEINQRLADGEDFRDLLVEYTDDTGMTEGTESYETGYYVAEGSQMWHATFVEGAMALEKVGDVSEPVFTANGLHLIYYYTDVTPGAVPLEDVRESLEESLLSDAQGKVYVEKLAQWQEECEVKTWPERLEYTGE